MSVDDPGESEERVGTEAPEDEPFGRHDVEPLFLAPTEHRRIGRYVVLDSLGEGGMGTVLEAFDRILDRRVALKLLHDEVDDEHTQRLLREAQALAKLSHPNVVQVYEAGQARGQTFIAMELVQGRSLRDWLRQEPRPGWRECVQAFLQAGEGLVAAHERGLIHRDFKPGNAVIDEDGRVRVLDFGLARMVGMLEKGKVSMLEATAEQVSFDSALTMTGTVLGTPAYMPPEQMMGQPADARSDQFSFCVSLYEALYGEQPYEGDSLIALMVSMKGGVVRPPRGSPVPAALRKALVRGLAVDAEQRWPSMEALLEQVRRVVKPRTRRWVPISVVGVLALGGGLRLGLSMEADPCTGASVRLEGVWDEDRRRAVEVAILGTELSFARDTWERVESRLDGYADAWARAHTEACEATAIHHEQSDEAMDLRMSCLRRRRSDLRATVDVLAQADAGVVEKAVEAVAGLPGLERCADVEALEAEALRPEDPAMAKRVEALEGRLSEAKAHGNAGSFDKGLVVVEEVVAEAETLGYQPLLVRAWLEHGILLDETGDYEQAESTLRRAYDAAVAGRMVDEAADASALLVFVLGRSFARYEEARSWAVHADPLSRATGAPQARNQYLTGLGTVAVQQGRLDEARELFLQALAISEEMGPDDPRLGTDLVNLGSVAYQQGRLDEARELFLQSLAIEEEEFGPRHPALAYHLSNLGSVALQQGKLDEARDVLERAIVVRENALGPDAPRLAYSLDNLGAVALQQGRPDEARDLHHRALGIFEKTLGVEHPSVGYALGNLGNLAKATGEFDEARDFYLRALAIFEATLGSDSSNAAVALNNLGTIASSQGRLDEARDFYLRALAILEKELGPEHFEVADALTNLGSVARRQGELEAARDLHLRALAIYGAALGPEHPNMAVSLVDLGGTLLELAEPSEALPHLERALAIRVALQSAPAHVASTRLVLARALWVAPVGEGRDRPRAHELAEQARDAYAGMVDKRDELAEIEAWLAGHRLP